MRAAGVASLIVGLTGDSNPEHDARALAAGQDHVLGKPFTDAGKLRRILRGLLRDRGAAAGGGASEDEDEEDDEDEES